MRCRKIPFLSKIFPRFIDSLSEELRSNRATAAEIPPHCVERLQLLLFDARSNAVQLIDDLHKIVDKVQEFADAMDFSFLLNERRMLLSIGYDVDAQQLHSACYDLLATESRTAVFVAIAKEDIDQESWFRLGRTHLLDHGLPVLVSWTGTIFEYLMPALWMRSYPNTLLERSRLAAVRSQQMYADDEGRALGNL